LQEVDSTRCRSNHNDQAQVIAEHLQMEFHFHPTIHLEEERCGDAILTHYPMRLVQEGHLPSLDEAQDRVTRGAIWVEIETPNGPIQVINTHLGLSPAERALQIETLLGDEWLSSSIYRPPAFFCGDFNLPSSAQAFKHIAARFTDAQASFEGHPPLNTVGAGLPQAQVDHIFMDKTVRVVAVEVPSNRLTRVASDHLPLIADVRWSEKHALSLTGPYPLTTTADARRSPRTPSCEQVHP
jgi:endonuclease/exonuclease/phosphatase family metal-dependent hydrolase